MIINRISSGMQFQNFCGINSKQNKVSNPNNSDNQKVPVLVNISQDKINSALKAAVLIPAASLPLIMGSCSKDCECDYWADGGGTSIKYPSIYVLPELKIDSLNFANDSVRIANDLNPDSKVNNNIRNFVDSLNIPNYISGDFPIRFAFKTPDYIQYMKFDGLASNDETYIYDTQKFNKNGDVNVFKTEVRADENALRIKDIGLSEVTEHKYVMKGDTLVSYKRNDEGDFKKEAVYLPKKKGSFEMKKITADGDTTKLTDFNLLYVNKIY